MIYLVGSDPHRDSLNLQLYATNFEGIEKIIRKKYKEIFEHEIRNVKVTETSDEITFQYLDFDGEWMDETMYYWKLEEI